MNERELAALIERATGGRPATAARSVPVERATPTALLRKLRASGEECFLLESVEGGEGLARYTFVGSTPSARLVIREGRALEERAGGETVLPGDPLEAIRRFALRDGLTPDPGLPPFSGGAVGYLAYDAVRLFERIPQSHPKEGSLPEGLFLLFDSIFAFDHAQGRLFLMTTVQPEGDSDGRVQAMTALARIDALEAFLTAEEVPPVASPAGGRPDAFRPLIGRERFVENVERAREAIRAGDLYQVVLSQRWTARLDVDPFDVYEALRELNPSPYLFYLSTREAVLLGASPEMLVRCRGRRVETRPIAGTARRGTSAREDEALARGLLDDPKERAEHVMLVDLARNDLGRVCELGSVEVARYAQVEKFSHVQHLVSEVRGRLAAGRTPLDALASCFPAGTLTGAPKIRAMECIDAWEVARRGIYGGAVGYVDHAGNLDFAIAIRAAVVEAGLCRIQAGAGIVADSVAEKEYREVESKAAALFRAVEIARARASTNSGSRTPSPFHPPPSLR